MFGKITLKRTVQEKYKKLQQERDQAMTAQLHAELHLARCENHIKMIDRELELVKKHDVFEGIPGV